MIDMFCFYYFISKLENFCGALKNWISGAVKSIAVANSGAVSHRTTLRFVYPFVVSKNLDKRKCLTI